MLVFKGDKLFSFKYIKKVCHLKEDPLPFVFEAQGEMIAVYCAQTRSLDRRGCLFGGVVVEFKIYFGKQRGGQRWAKVRK